MGGVCNDGQAAGGRGLWHPATVDQYLLMEIAESDFFDLRQNQRRSVCHKGSDT